MSTSLTQIAIGPLESGLWTPEWDNSINPVKPDSYSVLPTDDGAIRLYTGGPAGCAWLAKHVETLPYKTASMSFEHQLLIDDCTLSQIEAWEFDVKATDDQGWTYDGSARLYVPNGWSLQIGDPWIDTGVRLSVPPTSSGWMPFKVTYGFNYTAHTLIFESVSVGGHVMTPPSSMATIPAKQVGWGGMQIVAQMQPMNKGQGAQSQKVRGMYYRMPYGS